MSDPSPLPVTVIGGYLGAGKTTLVNHLLRHVAGRRLAVLVNDFGEIAIDAELIAARDGDSMTLANGCACCSIGGDLYRALTWALERRLRADALVIEASGVAEPARIAEIARAEPELRLAGTVVMADARGWPERSADPLVGALVRRQVVAADLVILNKTDLVGERKLAAIEDALAALAPAAVIRRAAQASIPPEIVLDTAPAASRIPDRHHHDHEAQFSRWSLSGDFEVSRAKLDAFLARLPKAVHRLKGFVTIEGDSRPVSIQAEGGEVKLEPAPPNVPASPACRLVAIGPRGTFDPSELDALKPIMLG